jgi:hypothetical protein
VSSNVDTLSIFVPEALENEKKKKEEEEKEKEEKENKKKKKEKNCRTCCVSVV